LHARKPQVEDILVELRKSVHLEVSVHRRPRLVRLSLVSVTLTLVPTPLTSLTLALALQRRLAIVPGSHSLLLGLVDRAFPLALGSRTPLLGLLARRHTPLSPRISKMDLTCRY